MYFSFFTSHSSLAKRTRLRRKVFGSLFIGDLSDIIRGKFSYPKKTVWLCRELFGNTLEPTFKDCLINSSQNFRGIVGKWLGIHRSSI